MVCLRQKQHRYLLDKKPISCKQVICKVSIKTLQILNQSNTSVKTLFLNRGNKVLRPESPSQFFIFIFSKYLTRIICFSLLLFTILFMHTKMSFEYFRHPVIGSFCSICLFIYIFVYKMYIYMYVIYIYIYIYIYK